MTVIIDKLAKPIYRPCTVRFIACFFLLGTLCAWDKAGAFEHPQYEIKATVDTLQKKIAANQTCTFTNNSHQDIHELVFHIYPNRKYTDEEKNFMLRFAGYFKVDPYPEGFPAGGMHIQSIVHQGKSLGYQMEGDDKTLLKIPLSKMLKPGEAITVSMDFTVDIPHAYGRFGWHENIIRASRWYPILSVHNEDGWDTAPFYPFHRPFFSEASNYFVELTVPQTQAVIHSGRLVRETQQADGTKTLIIKSSLPIREFTSAMSPDYQTLQGTYEGVTIKSFYLPGDDRHARKALDNARELMQFYTGRFGKYPYEEFSIAPVHLGYGGEQMSNLVFIDTRVYKLPEILSRYFDFLIAHETGHQWFYNIVGINEYTQMWLEEGVHSYFLLEYLEEKYGHNAAVVDLPKWLEDWEWTLPELTFRKTRDTRYKMISRIGMDHPIMGKLSSFREPSTIFSLTYGKGSRIVGMLREQLGDESFARVFQKIFKEFSFRNLDIKDFIQICETESGKDLSGFFEQWLYTSEKCDYSISRVKGQTITVENRGGIIMPVDVTVDLADGRQETLVWDSQEKQEDIHLQNTSPIKRVRIDPDEKLLDIDRTNNFWPRQLTVKPVPLYLGLFDIPVLMDEDAYNLVFGPELANSGIGLKAALHKPYDQSFYAATDYEFGESLHHSRVGYQLKNVLQSQTALGFEIANRTDLDGGEEDLVSGKVYIRRELWPAQYGLVDINDHATLYLMRNQGLNDTSEFLSGREDTRNINFSRKNESIVGAALHLDRSGPYPDPGQGYKLDTLVESAGHFLEATQYFHRAAIDVSVYQPVTVKTNLALRLKYGWGFPNDKDLFHIGGMHGLRGFGRKTIRGANALLGSIEYRFPIKENIGMAFFDNIIGLESIGGVVFFDAGQAWFSDHNDARLRKDAGIGLRFKVNIGSFLEKVVVRADVARAINESDEETEFWFGVNHAF